MKAEESVPAAFHQAIVLLFGAIFQTMLHCSGKMIPQIVKQLKPHVTDDHYTLISNCQGKTTADYNDDTDTGCYAAFYATTRLYLQRL